VRMALGARATDVGRLILAQGLSVAGLGLVLGMAGAMLLSRLMSSVLFGVEPIDAPTYLGVACALALIALLAIWLPARRAARVDPMIALRSD